MTRLQVLTPAGWKYVFCYNERMADPVTTADKSKALPGRAIDYFRGKFADHTFRGAMDKIIAGIVYWSGMAIALYTAAI